MNEKHNDEWMTPDWIIDILPPIDLDPCHAEGSHVVAQTTYDIRRGQNGLELPWHGVVFCNPPYTKTSKWLAKCRVHGDKQTAIALVPAVPGDGPWAREVWPHATKIGFLLGRVAFRDPVTDDHIIKGRGHALVVWGCDVQFKNDPRIVWVDVRKP